MEEKQSSKAFPIVLHHFVLLKLVQESLRELVSGIPGAGIICAPTALGVELLLWAFGHGDKDLDFLLTDDFSPEIEGIPKSVPNAVATKDITSTSN